MCVFFIVEQINDDYVSGCVCVSVFQHDKTITFDCSYFKLGTVVVLYTMSKPVDLGVRVK